MGWTGIDTNKSMLEVFKDEFSSRIVDHEYMAYSPPFDDGNIEEAEVHAAYKVGEDVIGMVILMNAFMRGNTREVVYKEMSESMGPYHRYPFNKRVSEHLSPLKSLAYPGYSEDWRKKQKIPI